MSSTTFNINPSTIYVYLRVSTKTQTYKSNGLEEQNNLCQEYIKKYFPKINSYEIKFYTDVGSSYYEKNVLLNLNKIIKKISLDSNSLILVRDVSRLGRNTFQVFSLLRKIKKSNSYIIGIEENLCYNYSRLMDKKFYHAIIDSEENSDLKSIKSINRIKKIKLMGGYIGRVPYGTQIIKKNNIPYIYKNYDEINTIRTIKKIFLKYLNIIKTTKYLNKKNIKYRNNDNWTEKQITNVVKKYFPNLAQNKNSDLVDKYFKKYRDYEQEINDMTNKIVDINIKSKRKYVKKTK
jgi:DNA invertase Pin-like site-specific DNA recombinase